MACDVQCLCYSVSTSESDSDDSGKGIFPMQDESPMTIVKEEEILTADSGESTAGEDDFNPFGNSGSEDEGNVLSTLYLSLKIIQESGLRTLLLPDETKKSRVKSVKS